MSFNQLKILSDLQSVKQRETVVLRNRKIINYKEAVQKRAASFILNDMLVFYMLLFFRNMKKFVQKDES